MSLRRSFEQISTAVTLSPPSVIIDCDCISWPHNMSGATPSGRINMGARTTNWEVIQTFVWAEWSTQTDACFLLTVYKSLIVELAPDQPATITFLYYFLLKRLGLCCFWMLPLVYKDEITSWSHKEYCPPGRSVTKTHYVAKNEQSIVHLYSYVFSDPL